MEGLTPLTLPWPGVGVKSPQADLSVVAREPLETCWNALMTFTVGIYFGLQTGEQNFTYP